MEPVGRTRWAIPEGYIPGASHGPGPAMTSHEAVCILNVSDQDARVAITVFYADRDPAGPYSFLVPARRTRHLRFNDLTDPEPIPRDTDYASLIESDVIIADGFSCREQIRQETGREALHLAEVLHLAMRNPPAPGPFPEAAYRERTPRFPSDGSLAPLGGGAALLIAAAVANRRRG